MTANNNYAKPSTLDLQFMAKVQYLYFDQKMRYTKIAPMVGRKPTTLHHLVNQHLKPILNNPNDPRYNALQEEYLKILEDVTTPVAASFDGDTMSEEKGAIVEDNIPQTMVDYIPIEDTSNLPWDSCKLLEDRKKLTEQLNSIDEIIEKNIEVVLQDVFNKLNKCFDVLNDEVGNLTIKQYRDKDYPQAFTCKRDVAQQRFHDILERIDIIPEKVISTESAISWVNEIKGVVKDFENLLETVK